MIRTDVVLDCCPPFFLDEDSFRIDVAEVPSLLWLGALLAQSTFVHLV
jgi:hypothetical protein